MESFRQLRLKILKHLKLSQYLDAATIFTDYESMGILAKRTLEECHTTAHQLKPVCQFQLHQQVERVIDRCQCHTALIGTNHLVECIDIDRGIKLIECLKDESAFNGASLLTTAQMILHDLQCLIVFRGHCISAKVLGDLVALAIHSLCHSFGLFFFHNNRFLRLLAQYRIIFDSASIQRSMSSCPIPYWNAYIETTSATSGVGMVCTHRSAVSTVIVPRG